MDFIIAKCFKDALILHIYQIYYYIYTIIYFTEKVLLPVLEVIEDHETSNMILRIMCEAWLDYIYLHRIKFR